MKSVLLAVVLRYIIRLSSAQSQLSNNGQRQTSKARPTKMTDVLNGMGCRVESSSDTSHNSVIMEPSTE